MDLLPGPLDRPQPFFVSGCWTRGVGANVRTIENPSDLDRPVATVAEAGPDDVAEAVSSARHGLRMWSATGAAQRAEVLQRIADRLRSCADDLGELLCREEGKTRPEGVGEVRRAADLFAYFAQRAYDPVGDALRGAADRRVEIGVERRPLGVVALITPWNYPIAIPAWKLAPALAYGNAAILKPAEQAPLSVLALTRICEEAGLPVGVLQVVTGGGEVGQALVDHPDVDGVSFTGSTPVGRRIAAATVARFAPAQLEMGGKNPLVVLDDADLEVAVDCAVKGAFLSTGQRCTASSRIIVTEGIYRRFTDALVERTRLLRTGPALASDVDYGPVIDSHQLQADFDAIAAAEASGANAAVRGEPVRRASRGHFLSPTLFTDTTNDLALNREEVFGPVAAVIPATDFEEALAIANDTPYGLVAGIVTSSLKHAHHFRSEADVGMVMVNLPTAGQDLHAPFGGTKDSSFGPKEQGAYASDFFTKIRTSYLRP